MKYTLTASTFAIGALASAGFAVLTTPDRAQAQSFSCANAQIPSEMAVCNNEILLSKQGNCASEALNYSFQEVVAPSSFFEFSAV